MVPIMGRASHSLKLFCMYDKKFEISKTKSNGGGNRTTDLTIYLHHLILAFIIRNQIIFVYIHKYIHALYIMNCSKKLIVLVNFIYDDTSQNATINNQV